MKTTGPGILRGTLSVALTVSLLLPVFIVSPRQIFAEPVREEGAMPSTIDPIKPLGSNLESLPTGTPEFLKLDADNLSLSPSDATPDLSPNVEETSVNPEHDLKKNSNHPVNPQIEPLQKARMRESLHPISPLTPTLSPQGRGRTKEIAQAEERVEKELSRDRTVSSKMNNPEDWYTYWNSRWNSPRREDTPEDWRESLGFSSAKKPEAPAKIVIPPNEDTEEDAEENIESLRNDLFNKIRDSGEEVENATREGKHIPPDVRATIEKLSKILEKISTVGMPKDVEFVALKEFQRYLENGINNTEGQKIKIYLDWLTDLPWTRRTKDRYDLARAKEILDLDHSGLDKVKKRIIEFLAVRKRVGSDGGGILLFVGPPGVGKTSIASAIAEAMGRKFVRLSLGGVSDQTDIRGHNRTYVGSQPGAIIQAMKKARANNPVMLLDEIDKMPHAPGLGGAQHAFLEILDPEQNNTFRDHYLEVPYDLSKILFIVTANELGEIPAALRDRAEIINFSGYTTNDKTEIAKNQIIPKAAVKAGIDPQEIKFSKEALEHLIERYTSEAGVRDLARQVDAVLRGIVATAETEGLAIPKLIGKEDIKKYLGLEIYGSRKTVDNGVGVATGLAVSQMGGSLLGIEVVKTLGTGALHIRKQMHETADDSAHNAYTYVKSVAKKLGIDAELFDKYDLDMQFSPATPVDGPSAGAAMATAIISELTGKAVKPGVAMTGEITIHGKILPIGGLKDKVMAAHRQGYKIVIFPKENESDLAEIPAEVSRDMQLIPVKSMDEVLDIALSPITISTPEELTRAIEGTTALIPTHKEK
jgi:endopeptidase La